MPSSSKPGQNSCLQPTSVTRPRFNPPTQHKNSHIQMYDTLAVQVVKCTCHFQHHAFAPPVPPKQAILRAQRQHVQRSMQVAPLAVLQKQDTAAGCECNAHQPHNVGVPVKKGRVWGRQGGTSATASSMHGTWRTRVDPKFYQLPACPPGCCRRRAFGAPSNDPTEPIVLPQAGWPKGSSPPELLQAQGLRGTF